MKAIDLQLPPEMNDHVRVCGACLGEGEYEQLYAVGCGGGYYRSKGPCDFCQVLGQPKYINGCGFVYQDGSRLPKSVLIQIQVYTERLKVAQANL